MVIIMMTIMTLMIVTMTMVFLIIICKILLEDIACGNTREPLERPSLHFLMLQSSRQMIMVQNLGVTKFLEMTRMIIT